VKNEAGKQHERLYVRPEEAAVMLGVSRATIFNRLADGTLPSIKLKRARLIPLEHLRRLTIIAA
jgi:excisionase family DNA binding protein